MFYTNSGRLLFIAAPKTGSTSVEETLLDSYHDGERFKIHLDDGRVITSKDVSSPSLGHAKARELRRVLGEDGFGELRVFGFVRDPIEKVVSSYFFTRSRRIRNTFGLKSDRWRHVKIVKQILSILIARLLPLWAWSLLYPMRDCHSYFTDQNGELIVDYLGSTERLSEDLEEILKLTGERVDANSVRHTNKSSHKNPGDYWFFRFWIPFLERRYANDLTLARLVKDGVWCKPMNAE